MSQVGQALRAWVAAARGAVEWELESGTGAVDVPARFQAPPLGEVPLLPGGVARAPLQGPAESPAVERAPSAPVPPAEAPESTRAVFSPEPLEAAPPGVAPPVAFELPALGVDSQSAERAAAQQRLRDAIGACERCGLCQGREEIVFGAGRPDARVAFVGDFPSELDDQIGQPFVGPAGQLLGRMIRAMGIRREDAYLTTALKCRPGRGADLDSAWQACGGFLAAQLDVVQPEVVVVLGEFAARALLGRDEGFPRVRGQWTEVAGRPAMVTFHPNSNIK